MARLATAELRAERARIRVRLARISGLAGAIPAASSGRHGAAMREVVDALDACLGPAPPLTHGA